MQPDNSLYIVINNLIYTYRQSNNQFIWYVDT